MNFHDARGTLVRAYPYAELRDDALAHARRFVALGLETGRPPRPDRRDRPRIRRLLLRRGLCRPVAGAAAAADQLRRARGLCRAADRHARPAATRRCSSIPPELADFAGEAAAPPQGRRARLGQPRRHRRQSPAELPAADGDEIAYLQYSSGSTRFPHGVAVTHRALLDNLRAHGIGARGRRHRPLHLAGCPGITTWAWSAACSRRSPTRCRSII